MKSPSALAAPPALHSRSTLSAVPALFALLAATGCNDLRSKTRAYVADTPCGQGPYELTINADGKSGEEGVEVIACTAHHLSGVAELSHNRISFGTYKFGDGQPADNGRCLAGRPVAITTAGPGGGTSATAPAGAAGAATGAKPQLLERPFLGKETRFADDLCKAYGLQSQSIMGAMLTRTDVGDAFHLRIWSDAPNDLEGVFFLVQQLTSKKSKAEVDKEWAKLEREQAKKPQGDYVPPPAKPRAVEHGPPPAPLAEARPGQPTQASTWIAGYWQWTGAQWGWVAGFWRDDRLAMPAQRVEIPGAIPGAGAIWVGGVWQLRAGAWIWLEGHWRL